MFRGKRFTSLFVATLLSVLSSSTNAALLERLGGLAYYDDEADLTWLADANYAATTGYDTDGLMTPVEANAWLSGLTVGGVSGWRLPETIDVGNDGATYTNIYQGVDYGYNITTHSELSNMFYNVLGNLAAYDTSGNPTACFGTGCFLNTGPFSNIQSGFYQSGTQFGSDTLRIWGLYADGAQDYHYKTQSSFVWAVQSGDISAVPVPAAVWLFGSGLLGLIGIARRK